MHTILISSENVQTSNAHKSSLLIVTDKIGLKRI